jgi:hypothetical protein
MKKELIKSKETIKKVFSFLKEDSWSSFFVNLLLAFVIIKFIFFPLIAFITGSSMPLVIVESCSMYHPTNLEGVLNNHVYSQFNISYQEAESWNFKKGLSKGDIIIVVKPKNIKIGDVIIFNGGTNHPIIHRVISLDPLATKGDNEKTNPEQLSLEKNIKENQLIGKALFRIPYLGWIKLVFFELMKTPNSRGFC